MSTTRKSSRIMKKSCINVKLNASEGIEFVDANGVVDNMNEWTAEIVDEDDEGDEELIRNPDGTMSINMVNKSNGARKEAERLDCEKCGLSFPTEEVGVYVTYGMLSLRNNAQQFFSSRNCRR